MHRMPKIPELMRYAVLLIMLVSNMVFAQSISMVPEVEQYVVDVVNEGLKRDMHLMSDILDNVDYILVSDDLPLGVVGAYSRSRKTILVSISILDDEQVLRSTIYHEIGHALTGSEHFCPTCSHIMAEYEHTYIDRDLYIESWDLLLNEYFNYIRTYKQKK